MHNKKKAFTLIELLVVIAIVSLLSTVILSSLNSARMKARDIRRVSDLKAVDMAMEMYRDKYGKWPLTINSPPPDDVSEAADFVTMANTLVAEGFLSAVPVDPKSSTPYRHYTYGAGSEPGEIIVAILEGIAPTLVGPYSSCRPFLANWCSHLAGHESTNYCICHPY